jgi:hypothetical protein
VGTPDQNGTLIVEFAGATGAGKSTLAAEVMAALADRGFRVREGHDAILASYGLAFVRRPKVRSALVHLLTFASFWRCVLTRDGFRLSRLAVRSIVRDAGSIWVGIGLLRNVSQRIGAHVLLQRLRRGMRDCDVVLCDEGIVQAAHNLFVHAGAAPRKEEIVRFAETVPRPDLLVWVAAPPAQSAEVILCRGHPRVPAVPEAARAFAERAHATFEVLSTVPALRAILHRIDNPAGPPGRECADIRARAAAIGDLLVQHCRPLRPDALPQAPALRSPLNPTPNAS